MGKAARNRAIRRHALEIAPDNARAVARSLRRHGRMPNTAQTGFTRVGPPWRWTKRNRKFAQRWSYFGRPTA